VEAWELVSTQPVHVHHVTENLAGFLRALP
jgi:hypothetical protein